jgi:threonine/homoserine/homoserine lactone efflux protein
MQITIVPVPDYLVPFLVVVAILTITPGPDMALGLKNGARGGGSAAWWTGLGCCAGIAVHACAAVAGLSAILAASATVFGIVKLAGAAYLIYLGIMVALVAAEELGPFGRKPCTRSNHAHDSIPAGAAKQPTQPQDRADLPDVAATVRRLR